MLPLTTRLLGTLLVALVASGCAAGETLTPGADGGAGGAAPRPEIQVSCRSPASVVQLSLSRNASYALLDDGSVWCWGRCLGPLNGIDTATTVPVRVNVEGAVGIGAGDYHACAVLKDGTVRCWGRNAGGEVGADAKSIAYVPLTDVVPVNVTGVASVGAGLVHTCALRHDGTVACWGLPYVFLPFNEPLPPDVQNPNDPHPEPVQISGIEGADMMSVGHYASCVRLPGALLRCFGGNIMPDLSSEKGPVRVFAGSHHQVCLVDLGGNARCHGDSQQPPGAAPQARGWDDGVELSLSRDTAHGCARFNDGRVRCVVFDGEYDGFSGEGWMPIPDSLDPVPGIYKATHVAVNDNHGCVIEGGCVRCWGYNGEGQLGDGTLQTAILPTFVIWP